MKTGFAFVYMKDRRDGEDAIHALDGREFGHRRRRLRVEWAKGDGDVKRREDSRRKHTTPTTTLFVVNFDVERTRERDLERHFEEYGRLKRVQIKRNYAFIQYETVDQATDAVKGTHLQDFMGRVISVEYVSREPDGKSVDDAPGRRSPSPRTRRPRTRSPDYRGRRSPTPRGRSYSRSPSRSRSRSRSPVKRRSLTPASQSPP
ncbi:hypothetical protein WJX73_010631 [Symbiochloris irregularis]|uniref:RRM domain-containing protein n=1 Tax=Symbiochloris irregularis TaxID=706552 RepID=A0AAW1NMN6_9CHLO